MNGILFLIAIKREKGKRGRRERERERENTEKFGRISPNSSREMQKSVLYILSQLWKLAAIGAFFYICNIEN